MTCKPYEIVVNFVHGEQAPQTERQQQMSKYDPTPETEKDFGIIYSEENELGLIEIRYEVCQYKGCSINGFCTLRLNGYNAYRKVIKPESFEEVPSVEFLQAFVAEQMKGLTIIAENQKVMPELLSLAVSPLKETVPADQHEVKAGDVVVFLTRGKRYNGLVLKVTKTRLEIVYTTKTTMKEAKENGWGVRAYRKTVARKQAGVAC